MAIVPVLSAVGICERCQLTSGGIYFLISHVLGARIGATVGILYTFGQV
jgi:potassium/chloride transporter 8